MKKSWGALPLKWDNQVFGGRFFELHTFTPDSLKEDEAQFVKRNRPTIVYVRLPVHSIAEIRKFEELGFRYAEIQIKLSKRLKSGAIGRLRGRITERHSKASLGEILKICATAFDTSRYYLDPHFSRELSGVRYQNWVKGLIGMKGIHVFEFTLTGRPQAFFMLDVRNKMTARFLLGGVTKKQKGSGIFFYMMQHMIHYLQTNHPSIHRLDTAFALANRAAFNIYQRLDFVISGEELILRKKYS